MTFYYRSRRARARMSRYKFPRFNFTWGLLLNARFLMFAFFSLLAFVIISIGVFIWFSRDLPTPGKLSNPDLRDSTKILDKDGELLFSFFKDANRIYVPINKIPDNLKRATIAAEDKDFYQNEGYSTASFFRIARDLILYRRLIGGSTITQQLVKNALLTPERSPTRKIKELILAIQVDKRYTKDEILEMYLNNVPYGGTAVGVEAASNLYFAKSVGELNLVEAAFLAGLPQLPSYYSPFIGEKDAFIGRTNYVLERMEADGYISREQMEEAKAQVPKLKFSSKPTTIKAPHFVMYVRSQLVDMFGEAAVDNGDLQVTTTLDYDIQKTAEEIVKEEIDKLKGYNVGNGASIVLDPKTGAILAMVGSKDYFDTDNEGNYNASTARRQPGSSLKPVMYATALEKGYTPATLIMDVQTDFQIDPNKPPYQPVNYDGKFRGPVQLRFALGNSLNIPAVKMLAQVGIKPVMEKAYEMGIENWQPTEEAMRNVGLSLVLGGRESSLLEITSAYGVFANLGIKKDIFAIKEVKDSKGNVLFDHKDIQGKRVLSEGVAFLISHILLDNNARIDAFGPSSYLNIPGKTVSVKTGTTDSKRDNWTIGYTPSYVVGVWVGNNNNSPMNPHIASGVTGASPIWNRLMRYVLSDKKAEQPQKPENVIAVEIDAYGGGLPKDGLPKRTEYFIKGTEPTTLSPIYKQVRISKHQGEKLANEEEVKRGDFEIKDFIVFSENDPVSSDGVNRWQKGINDWVSQNKAGDNAYKPPTETSDYKYDDNNNDSNETTPTPTSSSTPTPTP